MGVRGAGRLIGLRRRRGMASSCLGGGGQWAGGGRVRRYAMIFTHANAKALGVMGTRRNGAVVRVAMVVGWAAVVRGSHMGRSRMAVVLVGAIGMVGRAIGFSVVRSTAMTAGGGRSGTGSVRIVMRVASRFGIRFGRGRAGGLRGVDAGPMRGRGGRSSATAVHPMGGAGRTNASVRLAGMGMVAVAAGVMGIAGLFLAVPSPMANAVILRGMPMDFIRRGASPTGKRGMGGMGRGAAGDRSTNPARNFAGTSHGKGKSGSRKIPMGIGPSRFTKSPMGRARSGGGGRGERRTRFLRWFSGERRTGRKGGGHEIAEKGKRCKIMEKRGILGDFGGVGGWGSGLRGRGKRGIVGA